jgi:heat shock transcription factor|tara:strand:+ start:1432 stop:1611 length:180 start_codon:yes stop_codon:yes gene_type:complete
VRQLNNYGFRKCHSDRFEFGVEGFELGKPELLTTLKRHDAPRSKKGSGCVFPPHHIPPP